MYSTVWCMNSNRLFWHSSSVWQPISRQLSAWSVRHSIFSSYSSASFSIYSALCICGIFSELNSHIIYTTKHHGIVHNYAPYEKKKLFVQKKLYEWVRYLQYSYRIGCVTSFRRKTISLITAKDSENINNCSKWSIIIHMTSTMWILL